MHSKVFKAFYWTVLICLVSSACSDRRQVSTDVQMSGLKIPTGFHADKICTTSSDSLGSWVSMTFDDKGRIIVSSQEGGLYRLVAPAIGDTSTKLKVEKLFLADLNGNSVDTNRTPLDSTMEGGVKKITGNDPVDLLGYAQGLLWANNSLYVVINSYSHKPGDKESIRPHSGFYRLQDLNGDDKFDKFTLLKNIEGEGEHGPHSIALGPDGKSIYLIAGNFSKMPAMDASRNAADTQHTDNLYPMLWGDTHDEHAIMHGGWIAKTDSIGKNWELIASGFRNPFDMEFNEAGDLFTFDSDMEWDLGSPWYRPTRICHVTSGAEFGWRKESLKWSPVLPDNLPAVFNVGQGSPTGMVYGGKTRFPEKYRRSLFAFDWSFGIIYAFELEPNGASYKVKGEEFVSGSPLPLTDGIVGPDGALYFLTGGRGLDGGLYRVYYGDNTQTVNPVAATEPNEQGKIRRQLESYHGEPKGDAISFAWNYLDHEDRFVRYAARIAIEHQPVTEWRQKALSEKDPIKLTAAIIALARKGDNADRDQALAALEAVKYDALSEQQQIDLVRAIELLLARMGMPDQKVKEGVIAYLTNKYPAASNNELSRGLIRVLSYLDDPQLAQKVVPSLNNLKDDNSAGQSVFTNASSLVNRNMGYGSDIARVLANVPPNQQMYVAGALSQLQSGWTPALREEYFRWYKKAASFGGGASYPGFMKKMRENALAHVPAEMNKSLVEISGGVSPFDNKARFEGESVSAEGPGRKWTVDEAVAVADSGISKRDFARGEGLFISTLCSHCHSINGKGGSVGPNLSQVGTRFTYKDMLEAMIEPGKVISDQYGQTVFYLKSGDSLTGRLISQDNDSYAISQNYFSPATPTARILKKDVAKTAASSVSPMLPSLINQLNAEELKDLLAYLKAGGNAKDTIFVTPQFKEKEKEKEKKNKVVKEIE